MGAIKDAAFTVTLGVIDGWIETHEHQVATFLVEVPQECAAYSSVRHCESNTVGFDSR